MSEAYASDYDEDTAFERLLLERVSPIVPPDIGTATATYDVEKNSMAMATGLQETVGMTLADAVEQLGIVPLAFGAAWKVIDLLVEYAFAAAGLAPGRGTRWTITEKVRLARRASGQASPISPDVAVWTRVLTAYAAAEDVRHSLVHRRAEVDSHGAITGYDKTGAPLRPLVQDEQLAFCRAAQIVATAMIGGSLSTRNRNELCWHLDQLIALTGLPASGISRPTHPVAVVHVLVPAGQVDLAAIKTRVRQAHSRETPIDLVFVLPAGDRIYADLDDVPEITATLAPASIPPWSRVLSP